MFVVYDEDEVYPDMPSGTKRGNRPARLLVTVGAFVAFGGALGTSTSPGSTLIAVACVFCAGLAGAAAAVLIVRQHGASL